MNDKDASAGPGNEGLSDEALLARLGDLFAEEDPLPAVSVEWAQQSFGLRSIDAELASLTADSDVSGMALAVRREGSGGAPRLLTFSGSDLAVEIEVNGSGGSRRMLGQLVPPGAASIEVRQSAEAEARVVDADEGGRFLIEALSPGLVSLTCRRPGSRPVMTAWIRID